MCTTYYLVQISQTGQHRSSLAKNHYIGLWVKCVVTLLAWLTWKFSLLDEPSIDRFKSRKLNYYLIRSCHQIACGASTGCDCVVHAFPIFENRSDRNIDRFEKFKKQFPNLDQLIARRSMERTWESYRAHPNWDSRLTLALVERSSLIFY